MQLKQIKADCYVILKNSTVTSRQPDQDNNQKYNGWVQAMGSALTTPNFTENG